MGIKQSGFTLVELMVAVLLSTLLIMGVAGAFIGISQSNQQLQRLESAQEVLRSSQVILGRSVKQAMTAVVVADQLVVQQQVNAGDTRDCLGRTQAAAFTEQFRVQGSTLQCQVNAEGWVTLLSGVSAMRFVQLPDLISVQVGIDGLPESYPQADLNADGVAERFVRIDLALKSQILINNT